MEDALARLPPLSGKKNRTRLNPCCNGRCTRTTAQKAVGITICVLILVVMEDALAHLKSF